jgi:hypothetical protein
MEIRIWRRFFITPFLRVNLYTRGFTVSLGHNEIGWITFGKSGVRGTIPTGIPGVYLSERVRWKDLPPRS